MGGRYPAVPSRNRQLHRQPGAGRGPISRIRLASGRWVGGSSLTGAEKPGDYGVEVLSRGPVFAEARCMAVLGDYGTWELTVDGRDLPFIDAIHW